MDMLATFVGTALLVLLLYGAVFILNAAFKIHGAVKGIAKSQSNRANNPDPTPPISSAYDPGHRVGSMLENNGGESSPSNYTPQSREQPAASTNEIYAQVAEELEFKTYDKGLWTMLFAEHDGNETETKVAYIKCRAEQLTAHATVGKQVRSILSPHVRNTYSNPPDSDQEQMEKYGISLINNCYRYQSLGFDSLHTAVNYARQQQENKQPSCPSESTPDTSHAAPERSTSALTFEQKEQMNYYGIALQDGKFIYQSNLYDNFDAAIFHAKKNDVPEHWSCEALLTLRELGATDQDLMARNGVTKVGSKYRYKAFGYDKLEDALNFAERQEGTYFLAHDFYTGDFRPRDLSQAYLLATSASAKGHPDATFLIAAMHEHGEGTKKDGEKARAYYARAIKAGSKKAMLRISKAYLNGEMGFEKDIGEAKRYESLAAAQQEYESMVATQEACDVTLPSRQND